MQDSSFFTASSDEQKARIKTILRGYVIESRSTDSIQLAVDSCSTEQKEGARECGQCGYRTEEWAYIGDTTGKFRFLAILSSCCRKQLRTDYKVSKDF